MAKVILIAVLAFSSMAAVCEKGTDLNNSAAIPAATPANSQAVGDKPDAELQMRLEQIAKEAKGKVGVHALHITSGRSVSLNANEHFPMQSVYKLPIAMAMMKQVQAGKFTLEQKIRVEKTDLVPRMLHSPLAVKNPNGTQVTLEELIRLAVAESDGTASDVLLRLIGGPQIVQQYLNDIGVKELTVVNTEKELAVDWNAQYRNYSKPIAAVQLLKGMRDWKTGADQKELLLHTFMRETETGPNRLKGFLPKGTTVYHKTGTSGSNEGLTAATNDIGIIILPSGGAIAIAVFVSDSRESQEIREGVIAKIAKEVWDSWK